MNRSYIYLLILTFFSVLPSLSHAQYTIPDNTKKEVQVNPVSNVEISHDTTGLKLNNYAYERYKKAQERKRKNSFILTNSLTTNQTGYKNWAAGGTNYISLSLRSLLDHSYTSDDKKFYVRTTWDLRFGMTTKEYQDKNDVTKKKFAKNEDLILFTNNFNYKLSGKIFYDFNTSITTQFANTYAHVDDELPVSKFFAPATVNIGLGLSYKLDDNRMITVSPISGNMLFVNDKRLSDLGSFGVEPGKKILPNVGMNIKVNWLQPIVRDKNTKAVILSYKVLADMFYDYKTLPVLNWNNTINFVIFKYLTLNLNWTLKYDSRVEPQEGCKTHWQFNDILSIGVAYTFNNRAK